MKTPGTLISIVTALGFTQILACSDSKSSGSGSMGSSGTQGSGGSGGSSSVGADTATAASGRTSGSGGGTSGAGGGAGAGPEREFEEVKFLIEHNAEDNDTGYQIFVDGDPWNFLTLSGEDGEVLEVRARGSLVGYGLTEMFFETNEPEASEFPLDDVLALFPEGEYTVVGETAEGESVGGVARLTHDIPAPTTINAPEQEAEVDPDEGLVVSWDEVSTDLDGGDLEVVGYQVIVVRDLELAAGHSFATHEFNAYLPQGTTSVSIPREFLEPGTPYEIELLTLEESGNQTIAITAFETTGSGDLPEEVDEVEGVYKDAKFLIEHNASDDDTGYQLFADADPWSMVELSGPSGRVIEVNALGKLTEYGLTEMFFETNEPEASEFAIENVLALFDEGEYDYEGAYAENGEAVGGTATLSHVIPVMPVITEPEQDAVVDATQALTVSWDEVSESLFGDDIEIIGYQLIVVEDVEREGDGFYQSEMFIYVPPTTTSIAVPAEFLEPGKEYEIEVLAIEASGNQTIGLTAFETDE